MGEIRVGTASWADRMLLDSGWYPREANTPAGRLAYYAERFDLVEADTTFYAIPPVETTTAWAHRSPAGFLFNIKAFSLFTGHPTPVTALPRDLRPARSADRVRPRDLSPELLDEAWARFGDALRPLESAGKLGVVLLQFPPWFAYGAAAKRRIAETARRCRPARVAIELRHASWLTPANAVDTVEFLCREDLSFVCVDMPQGHASSLPPVLVATAEPAVMRFHGHSDAWAGGDRRDKFRYAYSDDELAAWAGRLRELADDADQLHVIMNNCCGDQAQRDAQRLAGLLTRAAAAG
ncbi:DUF72 domain-containing protein [Luedemannella flava]